jgi:hypothetical protein
MPMHDWTRVTAGTYHNFHVLWMGSITNQLNAGLLPAGYFAMAEQVVGQPEADVVTLQTMSPDDRGDGGVAVAPIQPRTRFRQSLLPEQERYARKARRIAIHHTLGEVVAVIEVVSPGNKDRKHSLDTFAAKVVNLLEQRVNLLIVDPFPPGKLDPEGIHSAIWGDLTGQTFALPRDQPLTVTSYQAEPMTAYVETIAVGDPLPEMPLFLYGEFGIQVPLEASYLATWNALPFELRRLLEPV